MSYWFSHKLLQGRVVDNFTESGVEGLQEVVGDVVFQSMFGVLRLLTARSTAAYMLRSTGCY